jgi:hypothetical protein
MPALLPGIRPVRLQVNLASFEAVRGTMLATTGGSPLAAGTILLLPAAASVFVAPAHPDAGLLDSGILRKAVNEYQTNKRMGKPAIIRLFAPHSLMVFADLDGARECQSLYNILDVP